MTTLHGPALEEVDGVGALTMGAFLEEVAHRFGPREALVFDDPLAGGRTVRWSYDDLRDHARGVAKALLAAGHGHGHHAAVLMGNRPEAVAAIFGAAMAGAVAVPLSTFATVPELAFLLDDSRASVVLTQTRLLARRFADDIAGIRSDPAALPGLRQVVAVGRDVHATAIAWDDFLAGGASVDDAALDAAMTAVHPDDAGLVIYSSGTTSVPKGVVHAHRAPTLQFWLQSRIFRRDESTRMWTALPVFWTAGLNTAMGATLAAGGCWVMQETFEPAEALALMARERVTEPYSLPHQTAALEEHPDWAGTDLSSLRWVFGKSAFARHPTVTGDTTWNMPVGYGLSETCAFFTAHDASTPREVLRRSVGTLLPGNELRVVEPDTGEPLPPGEVGELAIRGPTMMLHYVGKTPEQCFDADGFLRTGDTGYVDEHGELQFTGRRTEMIKTAGANVSPAELEVQLRACPPVKLARAVGIPDARSGEIVVLCITVKDGASATEDDIKRFLRGRVAAYKVPRHVLFFEEGEIPMTRSDTKVRDDDLVAIVQARLRPTVPSTTGSQR